MNTLPSSVNAAGRLAPAALLGTLLAATAFGQAIPSWQQEQAYSGGQFRLQTTGAPSPAPLGPKKPGVPRIGVLDPKAQMGQGSSVLDVGAPVRQAILAYLEGPVVDVVPIISRVEIQVAAEARQKECDYLLQTTVTKGHAGGGWRKTLGSVAPFTAVIPVVGMCW